VLFMRLPDTFMHILFLRQRVGPTDMRGALRLPVKSDELLDGLDLVRMVLYEADLVQYGYRM